MSSSPYLHGLGQSHPATPATPAIISRDSDLAFLSKRYEQFLLFGQEKTKFMNELMTRYEYLHQQHQVLVSELHRERDWAVGWQEEKLRYEQWMKNMQRAMAENPFIMILIDGDGMIFRDEFLRDGEAGGRRAAFQLYAAVQAYIENETNDIPLSARIVCRVYANVRGLGDVLVRTGTVQKFGQFEEFVRGFTRGKTFFDFVDVGPGKDRADEKIIESFKLFSQDFHCRRVLFGCSHDNGYARALEEYSDKVELLSKVVLLEGVPFEKELLSLPYSTKRFPDLFRDNKIVLRGSAIPGTVVNCSPSSPASFNMLSSVPAQLPASDQISQLMDSPVPGKAMPSNLPRTPSTSTVASDGFLSFKPHNIVSTSWAAKAAAPAPPLPTSPAYQPASREEVIARNRSGQRIDPPCKDYDKTEVDRVKKLKLCNVHFLRTECPYDDGCTHVHDFEPTKEEIRTLRLVARMAPCQNGSGCQDIKCIYGHRCPAPPQRNRRNPDVKPCIFAETCKFPMELHEIDTTVVKTLVVR
ncbi:hypothetical protein T440DRAFT_448823 [Plenodomus tracheiphilus IPT5]|uniref:C3H1-type domain-containing protein n=1 Tax=Plenodomus tracheiphilus IPT5 TaxID=1408161 RepID=A0A6A7BBM4_9PLEO|nr:hypothetical protein T440DRAFT_448823 [Plenodomus tracheiphilus IPT5]